MPSRLAFAGLMLIGASCTPKQVADKTVRTPAAVAQITELSVRGRVHASLPEGPVCTVYSLSGVNLGAYGPALNGGIANYSFPGLLAGTYDLVFEEPAALRKIVRVEYRALGPVYNFMISYGDVDLNGRVDQRDIDLIKSWQGLTLRDVHDWTGFGPESDQIPARRADFNRNLEIDADDLRMAMESVGKTPDPPLKEWQRIHR